MTTLDDATDYPAAHSMDTTWWGVDQHGHVAKFESCEAGATPQEDASSGVSVEDVLKRLLENPPPGLVFVADDLFDEADGQLYHCDWGSAWNEIEKIPFDPSGGTYVDYIFWLRDEAALQEVQPPAGPTSVMGRIAQAFAVNAGSFSGGPPAWTILRLPTPNKVVVWAHQGPQGGVPPKRALEWLKQGIALRGYCYGRDLDVERFGIYSYDHDGPFENWIAGPYARGAAPPRPLKVAELPAEPLSQAAVLKNADFARQRLLQPSEHLPIFCWSEDDPEWISTTGERVVGETAAVRTIPAPSVSGQYQRDLVRLVAGYLSLEPGATAIVGDYLEERGQPRLPDLPDAAGRLAAVVSQFFSPESAWLLEADCVEHALARAESDQERTAVQAAVAGVRGASRGEVTPTALSDLAQAALQAWSLEITENEVYGRNRLAWAAWALASRYPQVPMRTCQELDPAALAWQIERTLGLLDGQPTG